MKEAHDKQVQFNRAPYGWLSGERFGLMTWWLRRTFFPAYFRLSPLQKHVGKVVGGFGKESCVTTGVRAISPLPTVFSTHLDNFLPFSSNLKLSSANSFSLEESKICRLGKG